MGAPKLQQPATDGDTVFPSVWDMVNFRCRDSEIARVFNISRERVRQIRRLRGLPNSEDHQRHNSTVNFSEWIRKHRSEINLLTTTAILRKYGRSISYTEALKTLNDEGVKVVIPVTRNGQIVPWNDLNWRLPNRILLDIWQNKKTGRPNSTVTIGVKRFTRRIGRATLKPGSLGFDSAVAAEKAKAKSWWSK